jgi:hypothetical protein
MVRPYTVSLDLFRGAAYHPYMPAERNTCLPPPPWKRAAKLKPR